MHRVFLDPGGFAGDCVTVRGRDALHMLKVLRMSEGDRFVALDGRGGAWLAEVVSRTTAAGRHAGGVARPGEPSVTGRIVSEASLAPEPSCRVTIYQSIPRGDRMEFVVQKCTEVGVHSIVPIISERTVVRPGDRATARVERWRKIAREAAEQCGRRLVPTIGDVCTLDDIRPAPGSLLLVLWEGADSRTRLVDAPVVGRGSPEVGIVVGPEGGFSEGEVGILAGRGGVCVSLGPRILRTETAGLVAAALVLARHGDLG